MTEINVSEVQASNWQQLSYFRVYVHNDGELQHAEYPLFRNGVQQLRVTVRLAARNAAGVPVKIPAADLANVCLIDYTTSAPISFDNDSPAKEWRPSRVHNGYTWDRRIFDSMKSLQSEQPHLFEQAEIDMRAPEAGAVNMPDDLNGWQEKQVTDWALPFPDDDKYRFDDGYQYVEFYLATSSAVVRTFAACVSNSDGATFRCNYKDIDDPTGEGDKLGKFNSSFKVVPFNFPNLPNESYGDRIPSDTSLLRDTLIRSVDQDGYNTRAYEHHININLPNRNKVPIQWVKTAGNSFPRYLSVWGSGGSGNAKMSFTYLGYPGNNQLTMGMSFYGVGPGYMVPLQDLLLRPLQSDLRIRHPRSGELVIGQYITSNPLPGIYHADNTAVPNAMYSDMELVDIYGNSHFLRLGLVTGLNFLTLNK